MRVLVSRNNLIRNQQCTPNFTRQDQTDRIYGPSGLVKPQEPRFDALVETQPASYATGSNHSFRHGQ